MKNMTTVQLEKPLVSELEKLKTKFKATSYNDVIKKLVEQQQDIPKSLFGAFPNLPKFRRDHDDHEF
jgi:predicted CopG family antitoxin